MINGHAKLYDIVFRDPHILLVLEHFNIPFGFGDRTIAEVCENHKINEHLFLTIVALYCCKENVTVQPANFDKTEALQILGFLRTAHSYWLDKKIPKIKRMIGEKIEKSPGDKYSKIIKKFIDDYAGEVFEHTRYETTVVFPYVESLIGKQNRVSGFNIDQFKKHHSNIEDKLIDLKNLLIKHLPSEYDSVIRRQLVFELHDLERDINIHDFIENHLLIPFVEQLETEQK